MPSLAVPALQAQSVQSLSHVRLCDPNCFFFSPFSLSGCAGSPLPRLGAALCCRVQASPLSGFSGGAQALGL